MSTAALKVDDDLSDLVIEIDPTSIIPGIDPDTGMPRAEPAIKADEEPKKAPVKKEKEPRTVTLAELHAAEEARKAVERERDTALEARTKAEADAVTAREAAEAERVKHVEVEKKLATTQNQALTAHYHKAWSDYQRTASEVQQLANAIASTESLAAAQEAAYVTASEAGNHQAAAKAQREMARLEAEKLAYESANVQAKRYLEDTKYTFEEAQRYVATTAAAPADNKKKVEEPVKTEKPADPKAPSVDEWIAACPPATHDWLKEHKLFATAGSNENRRLMNFANAYADDHGGQQSWNDAKFVEALNAKFSPDENEEEAVTEEIAEEKPEAPVAKAKPAAPVTRGNPGRPSGSSNSIKLTQDQFDHAPQIYGSIDDLDPEVRQKFGNIWSPTAARYQYDQHLKRANKDGKFLRG